MTILLYGWEFMPANEKLIKKKIRIDEWILMKRILGKPGKF